MINLTFEVNFSCIVCLCTYLRILDSTIVKFFDISIIIQSISDLIFDKFKLEHRNHNSFLEWFTNSDYID